MNLNSNSNILANQRDEVIGNGFGAMLQAVILILIYALIENNGELLDNLLN